MVAAIDLDQFTQARLARSRLVDLRRALFARDPQAGSHHQRTNRFDSQVNAMTFAELLAGQCRPKIHVTLTDQRQRPLRLARGQLMVARTPTLA